jgi:hypothetical protein
MQPGPQEVGDRIFNASYKMLDSDVDEMHSKVLQASPGSLSAPLSNGNLATDLTWLLAGASPRTMGWQEKQLLQIDFPAWALKACTLAHVSFHGNAWLTPIHL